MTTNLEGMALMLLATAMTNVGSVLQKCAVDGMPKLGSETLWVTVRRFLRSPRWVAGWLLAATAVVLSMAAVGLADLSLLLPINGVGLAILVVAARIGLREALTTARLFGIGTLIVGVVLLGLTASPSQKPTSIAACFSTFAEMPALMSLLGLTLLMGAAWKLARTPHRLAGVSAAFAAAGASVLGLVFGKGVSGAIALGGLTHGLTLPAAWAFAGLALGFSALALVLQQLSFQKGEAIVVTPVFAASGIVLPLVLGPWVFHEIVKPPAVGAVVIMLVGVLLLTGTRTKELT